MSYEKLCDYLPDEAAGWSFKVDDKGYWIFENFSPAGENLVIEGVCKSVETGLKDIQADIKYRACTYNVDEHVDIWKDCRGERGVPESFEELVEDARAIGEMVMELNEWVQQWELPEESDCTRCPICGYEMEVERQFIPDENDVVKGYDVCDCPRCFFTGMANGVKLYWGYSGPKRSELRQKMMSEYLRYLDGLLVETLGD